MNETNEIKRAGRPTTLNGAKQTSLNLDTETLLILEGLRSKLGAENISQVIRAIIKQADANVVERIIALEEQNKVYGKQIFDLEERNNISVTKISDLEININELKEKVRKLEEGGVNIKEVPYKDMLKNFVREHFEEICGVVVKNKKIFSLSGIGDVCDKYGVVYTAEDFSMMVAEFKKVLVEKQVEAKFCF